MIQRSMFPNQVFFLILCSSQGKKHVLLPDWRTGQAVIHNPPLIPFPLLLSLSGCPIMTLEPEAAG